MLPTISVVTPTLGRPEEVAQLFENLNQQIHLPFELILVDGAPAGQDATEAVYREKAGQLRFPCRYVRHSGGTAIQRNVGIDLAVGDYIAFIDDDVRLNPDFFQRILEVFAQDSQKCVGGIAGFITNQYFDPETTVRWRWYRRLKLFTTYEPGKYDYESGYPINRYMRPPHNSLVPIDFMGAGCAVWRKEVFVTGLRFGEFFSDYGVLEDAHLALRARRKWQLLECGFAHCVHLHSPNGRANLRRTSYKTALNYRYVFMDIVPHRTWKQEFRFWRVQIFDLGRQVYDALRLGKKENWSGVLGKCEGIVAAWKLPQPKHK